MQATRSEEQHYGNMGCRVFKGGIKSTQYKKLAPNALRFIFQNLKSCKPYEKTKQRNIKMQDLLMKN